MIFKWREMSNIWFFFLYIIFRFFFFFFFLFSLFTFRFPLFVFRYSNRVWISSSEGLNDILPFIQNLNISRKIQLRTSRCSIWAICQNIIFYRLTCKKCQTSVLFFVICFSIFASRFRFSFFIYRFSFFEQSLNFQFWMAKWYFTIHSELNYITVMTVADFSMFDEQLVNSPYVFG